MFMMHAATMMLLLVLVQSFSATAVRIGRVNNASFTSVDRINTGSIWLANYPSWSTCVCAALQNSSTSTVLVLNSYNNGSCQLFLKLPYAYVMETNKNSTIILFQPLPPVGLAPCCSNISWLISVINASQQSSATVPKPSFLVIDDNNYLVTVSYRISRVQFNRTTMSMINNSTFINNPTSISYRNGMYYIPSLTGNNINVVSTHYPSIYQQINGLSGVIREVNFVRNGTLMLVASFANNQILFFDVFSTNTYPSTSAVAIDISSPMGLYVVNDSFIYVTSWATSMPISILRFSNNNWNVSPLPNTTTATGEKVYQVAVDICGRIWMSITGFGIRIFDPWGEKVLFNWPLSTGLDGILLLNNFELFLADFAASKILHFKPNITQCTS